MGIQPGSEPQLHIPRLRFGNHRLRSPEYFIDDQKLADIRKGVEKDIAKLGVADLIDEIRMQNIVEKQEGVYIRSRIDGEDNEEYSTQPGIRVYLNEAGKNTVRTKPNRQNADLTDKDLVEIAKDIWMVRLPEGTFAMSFPTRMQFHKSSTPVKKGEPTMHSKFPFTVPFKEILRIEGLKRKNADLWQNSDYHWDFQKKEPKSSKAK